MSEIFSGQELQEARQIIREDYAAKRRDEQDADKITQNARQTLNYFHNLRKNSEEKALEDAKKSLNAHLYNESGENSIKFFRQKNPKAYEIILKNGLLDGFKNLERKIAEGRLFADNSDSKTFTNINLMSIRDKAELNLNAVRQYLTKDEFDNVTDLVVNAREQLKKDPFSGSLINMAQKKIKENLSKFILVDPKANSENKEILANVIRQMNDWMFEQESRPTTEEILKEADRLTIRVSADVDRNFWADLFGIGDIETFLAFAEDLTPEQRAVATIKYDTLPLDYKSVIKEYVNSKVGVDISTVSDERILSELAGAWFLKDGPRFDRLIQQLAQE